MFSCCRCGNPKTKDGKPSKKSKQKNQKVTSDGEEEENNTTSPVPTSTSTSPPPDGQQNSSFSSFTSPLTSSGSPVEQEAQDSSGADVVVNGQVSGTGHKPRLASPLHDEEVVVVDNNKNDSSEEQEVPQEHSEECQEEINQSKDITNGIEKGSDGRGGYKKWSSWLLLLYFLILFIH